ncbi:hypothetical protein FSARC_256 [Fusarium sarcochroum]|uniref:Cobalamin-independent methionine synthase MetE C-terminal/archaeal domain-containing protein n=1 Tax=Fusarium sarcochroum TaxID=1208366 RepID=A0A8H4UBL8_9HYPO|nr:hypothetical protein FSARC_256 [Fusarium sarcochroum]
MIPRFRAYQVGSLIRPESLNQAFKPQEMMYFDNPNPDTVTIINTAISSVVQKQLDQSITPLVTGEYERTSFCNNFFEHLEGMEVHNLVPFPGNFRQGLPNLQILAKLGYPGFGAVIATGKIKLKDSPQLPVWQVMKNMLPEEKWNDCKLSIISPTWQHVHLAKGQAFIPGAYSSDTDYFADLTAAYRENLRILYDAGLRSVQIDDPILTYFALDDFQDALRQDGIDPWRLLDLYLEVHNEAIAGLPADMYTGIHLCHGNMPKSSKARQDSDRDGSLERIVEALFTKLKHEALYLEFDDVHSGSFEPLRFIPRGTNVVLGLVRDLARGIWPDAI